MPTGFLQYIMSFLLKAPVGEAIVLDKIDPFLVRKTHSLKSPVGDGKCMVYIGDYECIYTYSFHKSSLQTVNVGSKLSKIYYFTFV